MQITRLHPHFAAEITELRLSAELPDTIIDALQQALEEYAVIVVRDQQAMTDDVQIALSARFGRLQRSITIHREDTARRLQRDELSDISNVDEKGERMSAQDRRRQLQMPARLWHSDNSFRSPPGLFTFLAAKIVPPEGGDTEFADMRVAYDALEPDMRDRIDGLRVRHSLDWSRQQVGAPSLSVSERANIPEAIQPLVRFHPATGRKSLYLSSHARDVIDCDEAEGRALLQELSARSTRPEFVYSHKWREGDLVIWDNRTTMHRATPFAEDKYRRDMRRTSVEDDRAAVGSPT
jgi:alpha-ketoglutarate-dependent 2,4-dichlorophenoxyacetate dioxygenase